MFIHSDSFYREDNGNGYSIYERDAICSKCHKIIDRQTKYIGISDGFEFSSSEKKKYIYCPYCGEKLYK
jgi:DNA-directed RNA polymerase subunit RPC12/RpoP